jgi:hypothetical protein
MMTWCGSKNGWTTTACASALAIAAKALRNSLGPPISIGSSRRPALVAAKRISSTKGPLYVAVAATIFVGKIFERTWPSVLVSVMFMLEAAWMLFLIYASAWLLFPGHR